MKASILERLLAQLPGWLGEDMARLGGEAFAQAFVGALQRSARASCAAAPAPASAPAADGGAPPAIPPEVELRLLDEDVAEEEAMLSAIARRFAGSASLPLLLLGQRFGELLERPPLPAMDLPLGPRAFCDALAAAATELDLGAEARISLYRRVDIEGMDLYDRFADALDTALDKAGVLEGMSFVPLRRRANAQAAVAQATERDALQAVRSATESLLPESHLPPAARQARRDALAALAHYLMRHGRGSNQWSDCIAVAESLQDAALGQAPAPVEAQAWLHKAFQQLGYGEAEASQLAAGLAPDAEALAACPGDAGIQPLPDRGIREQRCFERLRALPQGATIGFSAGRGGFLQARLQAHHDQPPRLLLASVEDGCEIIFEADMLARMLASGEAWVVRHAMAGDGGG